MTPERWQQIKQVFQAAIERDRQERAAFLENACGADQELRREVESLIVAHELPSNVIDKPLPQITATLLEPTQLQPLIGMKLGHYKITEEIGRGGMGEVYLACDTRLDRPVAIKLLPASFIHDADRVRRFQQEARAASLLNHPNIVTIHEMAESEKLRFIVSEFVDGKTLREVMRSGLKMDQALDIVIQTASALSAAHNAGIIHRDIKPANIMVRNDGYVKVLDFGLAKLIEQAQPGAQSAQQGTTAADMLNLSTETGVVMGTVKYMSPEQARGQKVDYRTDIFSLGVLLYEMLAGRAPFEGETPSHTIVAILEREPQPIANYLPEAPAELQRIIAKALRKNRDERYQTVATLRTELEEVRNALTAGSRQTPLSTISIPAHTTSSAEYLVSEIKRHKIKVAIATLIALLLIAGASIGLFQLLVSDEKRSALSFDNVQFRRLTNLGTVPWGAISPDGKYVAYAVRDEKGGSYWLKQIGTESTRLVFPPTGPVELWGLSFSPDSNYFYYLIEDTTNRMGGILYRVPVLGGEPRRMMSNLGSFTISPDGRQILLTRLLKDEKGNQLGWFTADIDGANERFVQSRPAGSSARIIWSPDGESLVVFDREEGNDGPVWNLSEVSIADGKEKPILTKSRQPLSGAMWLPDRSGLLLLAPDEAAGVDQIWHLSYPDLRVRRVTRDLNHYRVLSVTADGKSMVAAQASLNAAIWSLPLAAPAQAEQITAGISSIGAATMTPDKKIVYSLAANGAEDLWEMAADGSQARQLTFNSGRNSQPSVSADGRYIVFTSTRSGRPQIWRIDRDGSNPVQLSYGKVDRSPSCSPVGPWVAFVSQTSGEWAVWKVPLAGGEAIRLSGSVETCPVISPNGQMVAYEYLDETTRRIKLAVQPLEGGPVTTIGDSDSQGSIRWSRDGKALAYVSNKEGRTDIWAQPLTGGAPKKLTDFKAERIFSFDWSPDGKQLICTRGRASSDLVLISNFK
jgi:eukaryotic-like serine/threonine-protein kinase